MQLLRAPIIAVHMQFILLSWRLDWGTRAAGLNAIDKQGQE